MTYQDLTEAIAAKIAGLWPARMLYRDFCPADFQRPSGFLYVTRAGWADACLGLVRWEFEAELALRAATDAYDTESTEALRADQLAVLGLFGGPSLRVGDRHVLLQAAAETPGPGVAYVRFTASWLDGRPGYMDADTAPESESGVPRMEQYQFDVRVGADVPSSGPLGHLPPEGKAMKGE